MKISHDRFFIRKSKLQLGDDIFGDKPAIAPKIACIVAPAPDIGHRQGTANAICGDFKESERHNRAKKFIYSNDLNLRIPEHQKLTLHFPNMTFLPVLDPNLHLFQSFLCR